MNRRYAQWTDEELKRLAAIGAAAKACGKPVSNICRLDCWRSFCEGFEMASPGSVYHPEQEIELMTAALDDAVVLANGQCSSAVKVLSNHEYPHSWALPDDDCWPERTGGELQYKS